MILDRGGQTGRLPLARLKIVQLDMDWTKLNTDGLQMVMEMLDYLLVKKGCIYLVMRGSRMKCLALTSAYSRTLVHFGVVKILSLHSDKYVQL